MTDKLTTIVQFTDEKARPAVATLTEEEIEAREAEGIVTLDDEDARLDLVRRYRELLRVVGNAKSEMEDIAMLLKEDAKANKTNEMHYNGHKVVSFTVKHNRSTNLNKLMQSYPTAYAEVVKETESFTMNTSEIKE